jgi:hypothetical protein
VHAAIAALTIGVALGILAMVGMNFELDATHWLPDTTAAIQHPDSTGKDMPERLIGVPADTAKREDTRCNSN